MRSLFAFLFLVWLCVACASTRMNVAITPVPPKPEPPVAVDVLPHFAHAGSGVRITVRMAESPDNRLLRVQLDSEFSRRAHDEDWTDGRFQSPKILTVQFDSMPEGHYVVTCILLRANGQTYQANDTICLAGPNTDCGQGVK